MKCWCGRSLQSRGQRLVTAHFCKSVRARKILLQVEHLKCCRAEVESLLFGDFWNMPERDLNLMKRLRDKVDLERICMIEHQLSVFLISCHHCCGESG